MDGFTDGMPILIFAIRKKARITDEAAAMVGP